MRIFITIIAPLLLGIFLSGCIKNVELIDGILDEGMECYMITTSEAIFYYQKDAGGFSSILDNEGIDWIGFHPDSTESYPRSAASSFRGLPNLVYRSDDSGAGHPGFSKCTSTLVSENRIRTESKSNKWAWTWTINSDHAILELEKVDPEHAYWLLYEGIPGGIYQPHKQYWGTDKGGPDRHLPDYYLGNSIFENWQWAYFGHEDVERVFFIAQQKPDNLTDTFGYLGNSDNGLLSPDGMVVFGLGREKGAQPMMTDSQKFIIGFLETSVSTKEDHKLVSNYISDLIKGLE